jgi:3'(2'), 5'-bisphosphate nucleotidase
VRVGRVVRTSGAESAAAAGDEVTRPHPAPPVEGTVFAAELAAACSAARAGGDAAMRHYGTTEARTKSGGSPVTAADHAADEAVQQVLRRAFPDDALLSEETRDDPARLGRERVWIVDPLDGTREFLAMNGEFAVMVGLAVGERAVAGAVFLPAPGILYAAAEGGGAWCHEGDAWRRLRAVPAPESAPRLVGSRSHAEPLLVRMQEALGIVDVRPSGSVGVKCGLIARGERDLYVHPVPYLKEWDTCAPEVVLREAGGSVTDCLGAPLRYNRADPVQPDGILACGPGVLERVLETVSGMYRPGAP